ncbi:MAG: hypothetical protein O7A63_07390 [Acidobacteria bacterium]|nr:hypothetical protein [Acidobacteriota bacterium]
MRKKRRREKIPDNLIYGVCERFLQPDTADGKRWNAETLVKWLKTQKIETSREGIFPLIRYAIRQGYVRLCPPRHIQAEKALAEKFPRMPADTRVLDVQPPMVSDNLAAASADLVLSLIKDLGPVKQRKHEGGEAPSDRVHIGFGAGDTTRQVAEKLALRMKMEAQLPEMTIHALSSGFSNSRPLSAPVAFFPSFSALNQPIEFVGLFSPPFVRMGEYDDLKKLPAIKESFREAKKIDIVVTSLAQADDEHGLLNSFLTLNEGGKPAALATAGHIGDVQWQPFSETEPLTDVNTGILAVTLFNLPELVELAGAEDKHVILVAGPCNGCGKLKDKAVGPLLTQKTLKVCNHLITDVATAGAVLSGGRTGARRIGAEHHVD